MANFSLIFMTQQHGPHETPPEHHHYETWVVDETRKKEDELREYARKHSANLQRYSGGDIVILLERHRSTSWVPTQRIECDSSTHLHPEYHPGREQDRDSVHLFRQQVFLLFHYLLSLLCEYPKPLLFSASLL